MWPGIAKSAHSAQAHRMQVCPGETGIVVGSGSEGSGYDVPSQAHPNGTNRIAEENTKTW